MQYRIIGTTVPAVEIKLPSGAAVYTQSGGMAWRGEGIDMDTGTRGGIMKGLARAFSGESMFMVTYKAYTDSVICFSSTAPGSIMAINANEHIGMILQKGAFLCAEDSVELSTVWRKGVMKGLFGGEGFIMQRVSGNGIVFAEFDGHVAEYDLQDGQQIIIDTGHLAAMTATCKIDVKSVSGVKNMLFGGEGFFNTVISGPGRIWLQTMPAANVAGAIAPYIATGK